MASPIESVIYNLGCFFLENNLGMDFIYSSAIWALLLLFLISSFIIVVYFLISLVNTNWRRSAVIFFTFNYIFFSNQSQMVQVLMSTMTCRYLSDDYVTKRFANYYCPTDKNPQEEYVFYTKSVLLPLLLSWSLIVPGTLFAGLFS
jgi:hypothetical protein